MTTSSVRHADAVLYGGTIVTMDPARSRATAAAVRDGRVLAVGRDENVRDLVGPATVALDLHGRTVTPGLIDGHAHLDREGLKYLYPSLGGARSIGDVLEIVRRAAGAKQPGEWVVTMPIGTPPWYFDGPESLAEGRGPNRHELDRVAPLNPVYIRGPWGYWNQPPLWSFANSAALERAGLDRHTRPPGSTVQIERDAAGEPTGVFREDHPIPVLELTLFRAVPRFTHADRVRALKHSMALHAAAGTTGVYEGHGVAAEVLRAYRELWEAGEQTVRAYLVLSPTWDSVDEAKRTLRDWLPYAGGRGFGDERLRVGGVFLPLGGQPEVARLARAAVPYTAWAGFVDRHTTPDEYRALAELILRQGLRLNTIVSERLEEVLDVLEAIGAELPLFAGQVVLQHLRVASRAAIDRMQRLRAFVTTQPASYIWKAGAAAVARGVDGERLLPHRDLLAAGLRPALATDNKPYRPLFTYWSAIARIARDGGAVIGSGQVLDREEALRALTLDAARLCFDDHRRGSLEVGKLADLVVFGRDPLTAPLDELPELPIDLTMIGGRIVHRAAE